MAVAMKTTQDMTEFSNKVSDLTYEVAQEIGVDVAASILIGIGADYARLVYGPEWLERAKDILEQKKTAPPPPEAKHH